MSKPILNLGNAANWLPLWFGSFTAEPAPDKPAGYTLPIDPILVPVLLENHIIAVVADSLTAKPTWKLAGKLVRLIRTGIIVGGATDAATADPRKIYLDRVNLFTFRELTETYALQITPQWYFNDIKLSVFVYTGVDSDTVTEQLDRIELAVDQINQ